MSNSQNRKPILTHKIQLRRSQTENRNAPASVPNEAVLGFAAAQWEVLINYSSICRAKAAVAAAVGRSQNKPDM